MQGSGETRYSECRVFIPGRADIVNAGTGEKRPDIVNAGSGESGYSECGSGKADIVNAWVRGRPDIVNAWSGESRYSECRVQGVRI
ncbi:unnamed protein product [Staurois parvus]|uniref:Uncharacterized protein n=1 Tax=Staurois parvus TaxID=386267 RepID=A0ABN9GII6_9NEOB|nr:unnamed protein product [Staurois parvus]